MWLRLLPLAGILFAAACFGVATSLHPGGYDWNRDYISTLLRGSSNQARMAAIAALLVLCLSIAVVFARLARAAESSKSAKVIQIGGIGSMVYASLTMTPLHDLMVTISLVFFVIAVLALLWALYVSRNVGFLIAGCGCLLVLLASATIYYTGHFESVLPWGQRASFVFFAVWLVSLELSAPRLGLPKNETA